MEKSGGLAQPVAGPPRSKRTPESARSATGQSQFQYNPSVIKMGDSELIHQIWHAKANENIDQWGIQDPAVILLAMQEELGELTQAYLEATYEDGDHDLPREEMHDLGALLFQLHWALTESERAFTEVGERAW